jgi:hypothetical protein
LKTIFIKRNIKRFAVIIADYLTKLATKVAHELGIPSMIYFALQA